MSASRRHRTLASPEDERVAQRPELKVMAVMGRRDCHPFAAAEACRTLVRGVRLVSSRVSAAYRGSGARVLMLPLMWRSPPDAQYLVQRRRSWWMRVHGRYAATGNLLAGRRSATIPKRRTLRHSECKLG